jgi:hypothetical protein
MCNNCAAKMRYAEARRNGMFEFHLSKIAEDLRMLQASNDDDNDADARLLAAPDLDDYETADVYGLSNKDHQ